MVQFISHHHLGRYHSLQVLQVRVHAGLEFLVPHEAKLAPRYLDLSRGGLATVKDGEVLVADHSEPSCTQVSVHPVKWELSTIAYQHNDYDSNQRHKPKHCLGRCMPYLYGLCPANNMHASLACLISAMMSAGGVALSGMGFIPMTYSLPSGFRCRFNLQCSTHNQMIQSYGMRSGKRDDLLVDYLVLLIWREPVNCPDEVVR